MRILFIAVGSAGDDGEHYRFEAEVDVADEDEAYVKGREFERLIYKLTRGSCDETNARIAARAQEDDEA